MTSLYNSAGWSAYTENPEKLRRAFENSLCDLSAFSGEKLVGIIRAVGDGITILFIQDILARPEYQRKGIGKGLLQAMLKRYSDVCQTELLTDDGSDAVKFYGAMGFEKAKRMGCCAFVKFNRRSEFMQVDFYYYSYQCPLNYNMLRLLSECKDIELNTYDIAQKPELAEKMQMYFPTLTIINGNTRRYSPITAGFIEELKAGRVPKERPFCPKNGTKPAQGRLVSIGANNIEKACLCCGSPCAESAVCKAKFLELHGEEPFGYMLLDGKKALLGGAEYLPSLSVPYSVPKDEETAFITCCYLTDEEYDCKSAPLSALERSLAEKYSRVTVISDEKGVFPNGNMEFFLLHGYQDEGIVYEDENYCRLHLMSKQI